MNTKTCRIFTALVLLGALFGSVFAPTIVNADTPADILDSYTIEITPQIDGSLVMNYSLQNYCTYSDWPSDQPYLQIGVPNSNFSITDWGPRDGKNRVVKAESVSGKFVQLDFDRSNLPKNGDCFNLFFSIVQNKMAYPDPENGNITFKFIPSGWEFPIQVKLLTVAWAAPSDPALLKLTEPKPSGTDGVYMIWKWASPPMNSAGMFSDATIKFAYDKGAFQLSEAATTTNQESSGGFDLVQCFVTVLIVILVVLAICFIVAVITEAYDSGDGIGPATITVIGNISDAVDDFSTSAGDGGGSSGHSSGCACANCACACACAGGGKVGCSRKAIGTSCLGKVIEKMAEEERHERDL